MSQNKRSERPSLGKSSLPRTKFGGKDLPPFARFFYVEHRDVAKMTPKDQQALRDSMALKVLGKEPPKCLSSFSHIEPTIGAETVAKLLASGFTSPTPIQCQSWPVAFSGRNMVGVSATGSGKTLAFALPALVHISKQISDDVKRIAIRARLSSTTAGVRVPVPRALVLAPTRELSLQIYEEFVKFKPDDIKCACVYGGVGMGGQAEQLKEGVDVLIATPGRLIDHLQSGNTTLANITFVVLDEADRMLDLGFHPQIQTMFGQIRPDRQVLMFTATWNNKVQSLAASHLKDNVHVVVGSKELSANDHITQHTYVLGVEEKKQKLEQILRESGTPLPRTLIFVRTKKSTHKVEMWLQKHGFSAAFIHGDKTQNQRILALEEFSSGKVPILVATDVASRGLDIKDVAQVINYDMPQVIEQYVHRIGRTARAGASGVSHSFVNLVDDLLVLQPFVEILVKNNQHVPHELARLYTVDASLVDGPQESPSNVLPPPTVFSSEGTSLESTSAAAQPTCHMSKEEKKRGLKIIKTRSRSIWTKRFNPY